MAVKNVEGYKVAAWASSCAGCKKAIAGDGVLDNATRRTYHEKCWEKMDAERKAK